MFFKRFLCSLIVCVLFMSLVSCSIPAKKPEEGVWYCDELGLSIDFNVYMDAPNECVKLYNDEGSYETLGCHFDYGAGIGIYRKMEEKEVLLITGSFRYKDEKFVVTTHDNNNVYIFYKQNETE